MRHAFEIDGVEHEIWLERPAPPGYRLHAPGTDRSGESSVAVAWQPGAAGEGHLLIEGQRVPVVYALRGDECFMHLAGQSWRLQLRDPLVRAAGQAQGGADDAVRAPMPGTAVSVSVKAGDAVARGAVLMVMESMKLETSITAPRDARVLAVAVAPGQVFDRDALLVSFEPAEGV